MCLGLFKSNQGQRWIFLSFQNFIILILAFQSKKTIFKWQSEVVRSYKTTWTSIVKFNLQKHWKVNGSLIAYTCEFFYAFRTYFNQRNYLKTNKQSCSEGMDLDCQNFGCKYIERWTVLWFYALTNFFLLTELCQFSTLKKWPTKVILNIQTTWVFVFTNLVLNILKDNSLYNTNDYF